MSMQFGDFNAGPAEPLNLGPNIFPAQPGQLPPEAYQSQTPTVRTLHQKLLKTLFPLNTKLILSHQKLSLLDFNQSSHQVELNHLSLNFR